MSQLELAEQTNLSLRTIQRIENDKNAPRGYTIKVIGEALQVDPILLAEPKIIERDQGLEKLELTNLSILSFITLPFGNLIFPVMLWSRFSYFDLVDKVGRRMINFQITWSIITYSLLSISPFVNGYLETSFPIIFMVLIAAYVINISCVWQAAKQIKAGDYQVYNRSFKLL